MSVVITGGAGFLGTNLSLRLVAEGYQLIIIDDFSTSSKPNISLLENTKNVKIIRHNIVDPFPKINDVDFIYNLACPASPPKYQKDPIQTFRSSIWGVYNVLEFAKKDSIPILHSSTSEVYGDPLVHPQKESYWGNVNPIGVRSCYDEGKRSAETLLFDFHRTTAHPIKVVRIFNTYGPHMAKNDGRVISNIINQALNNEPLTIYGDGLQTRSFCYVDDLIDGIIKMNNSPKDFIGPVNLGNPTEYTMLELVKNLEFIIGKKLDTKFFPLPKDDPTKRCPDISLAKSKLSWEPKVTLTSGLQKTIHYFLSII